MGKIHILSIQLNPKTTTEVKLNYTLHQGGLNDRKGDVRKHVTNPPSCSGNA